MPSMTHERSRRDRRARVRGAMLGGILGIGVVLSGGLASLGVVSLVRAATAQPGVAALPPVAVSPGTNAAAAPRGAAGRRNGVALPTLPAASQRDAFSNPLMLPRSDGLGEPSMIADHAGNIYVATPGGIGSQQQTVDVWKSANGGSSFVGPITTANIATQDGPVGGGDADLAVDSANDLFVVDLWLGNSSMAVSTDGANTWTGIPWGHTTPMDDRPWLTYDPANDDLYAIWDGGVGVNGVAGDGDGIHVGKASLRHVGAGGLTGQDTSLVFAQDVIAVPESSIATPADENNYSEVRECVCPTGNLVVDPHGNLWFPYSRQNGPGLGGGVGIAESKDGGITWKLSSVPGSGHGTGPIAIGTHFPVLRGDSQGNLYVTWSEPVTLIKGEDPVPEVFYSWLTPTDTQWHAPVQVSATLIGAVFPALAVVRPGTVDIAWYNETPQTTLISAQQTVTTADFDLDVAQSVDATSGANFTTSVAYPGIYVGSPGLPPRFPGFGDFFSMIVDGSGMADIVSDVNTSQNDYQVMFLHQTAPIGSASTAGAVRAASGAQCPAGLSGTPPDCAYQPVCPTGSSGVFPNCTINQTYSGGSTPPPFGVTTVEPGTAGSAANGGATAATTGKGSSQPPLVTAGERAAVATMQPSAARSSLSSGAGLLAAGLVLGVLLGMASLARVRSR